MSVLTTRLLLKPKSSKERTKKQVLTEYTNIVNHMLEKYTTDTLIMEAGNDILHFTPPTSWTPLQFTNALYMKVLHALQVFDKYVLKGKFIE